MQHFKDMSKLELPFGSNKNKLSENKIIYRLKQYLMKIKK